MIAQCAVRVVLALALGIRAIIPLVQFDITLSLGHFSNFEAMLVALVREALDLAVVEVLDAEQLETRLKVFLPNDVDLLEQMLVLDELLVELLIVALARAKLGHLDLKIASERLWRVLHAARGVGAVRAEVLVHHLHEVVLEEHLVIAVVDAGLTQKVLVIALVFQI